MASLWRLLESRDGKEMQSPQRGTFPCLCLVFLTTELGNNKLVLFNPLIFQWSFCNRDRNAAQEGSEQLVQALPGPV